MGYVAKAMLVIAADESGVRHHVYQGAPLPGSIGEDELKRLFDEGFIEEAVAPDEEPAAEEPVVDEAPKGNASREEWAAYAKEKKGAPNEETRPVEEGGLKQTELREKYGN
jgi:hypothetical protein